jgi:hypothetical protein
MTEANPPANCPQSLDSEVAQAVAQVSTNAWLSGKYVNFVNYLKETFPPDQIQALHIPGDHVQALQMGAIMKSAQKQMNATAGVLQDTWEHDKEHGYVSETLSGLEVAKLISNNPMVSLFMEQQGFSKLITVSVHWAKILRYLLLFAEQAEALSK